MRHWIFLCSVGHGGRLAQSPLSFDEGELHDRSPAQIMSLVTDRLNEAIEKLERLDSTQRVCSATYGAFPTAVPAADPSPSAAVDSDDA